MKEGTKMTDYEIGVLLFELEEQITKTKQEEIDYLQKESKLLQSKTIDHLRGTTEVNYKNKIENYSKGIEDSIAIIEQKRRELFSKEMEKNQ